MLITFKFNLTPEELGNVQKWIRKHLRDYEVNLPNKSYDVLATIAYHRPEYMTAIEEIKLVETLRK